ncbi:uncharacterized protein L969DRAFT_93915 [Mixia osmundae IAM 14324]|uniref:Condensin complex subunit 1 n=1 Tax=Mixia osmundae (strain CBS 9802 / IAM 14324 / JCM 22182 / KY 12970) TaxID=764103 RepID=G7E9Y6_MIXOS|nr:uncharacterized protein L969DRAFT_93915 [Mixia osmundae IAM 14324]KEI40089.1 hypothetical protein L969DRAFT_93915 [Mixia osmundae IAM 14324]GAA99455.1 hypothetical protein E5Q_06154 [Mixia osmundae IAM 14324]
MDGFDLAEEVQCWASDDIQGVQDELDSTTSPATISSRLNDLILSLASSSERVTDLNVLSEAKTLIKGVDHLTQAQHLQLLDGLCSAFLSELDSTAKDLHPSEHEGYRAHLPALEIYAFLVSVLVAATEKSASKKSRSDQPVVSARGRGKKATASAGKKSDWTWQTSIPDVLALWARVLRLKTERLWSSTSQRDTFIGCITRPAHQLAESELYMKSSEIRMGYYRVISLAVKSHGQAFATQTQVIQSLQYFEHLSDPMADLLAVLAKEFDHTQVAEEVLRQIAAKQFNAQDTKGPRSFSRFLTRLAELSPRIVLKQISTLQKHLDSESYPMRNAILDVLGTLIKELSNSEDGDPEQQKKQLEAFFDLLFERFLDLNSYVRSKVAGVFLRILDLPTKFPKTRLELTRMATKMLEDKSSAVRKNCISLLIKLILTHPYGRMHGGELAVADWQARYDAITKELEPFDAPTNEAQLAMQDGEEAAGEAANHANGVPDGSIALEADADTSMTSQSSPTSARDTRTAETPAKRPRRSDGMDIAAMTQDSALAQLDQDQLNKLRLTKRYYADALAFIHHLSRATPVLVQLIASTVKSEVLESMEFFRIASDYKLEDATLGIKRMLHLIWAKDNSTMEDGQEVKGVRSKLVECYKTLFFDALPDLIPKDNVSRIARNLIQLTFAATLADLTSLEQLLAVMTAEKPLHDDIINKLWQVYSTPREIPRAQRRGSIIILGMLAAPRPEIVSERIDLILTIGLGKHGKSDLVLAKYSCIALKRLGGSQKKVKGSLADKSIRLPMDGPIFERLREALETPADSQEWFSMAEQALNTIYALGEQPDTLCSSVIRHMTVQVFGLHNQPDVSNELAQSTEHVRLTGDAFSLARLIFVAGHCGIKHLIHLELVEREFKRRKAEADKASAKSKTANEELDQVAGNVEDDIGDIVAHAREKELLYAPDALLSIFAPMCVQICSQPTVYDHEPLQIAAALSMSKFMCVSLQFCEKHLMLLFKIFETTTNPIVRSNIVIALGDIAVCFSALMDQNSDNLYGGLTDADLTVKKNTLMVLTHLILNGMIKVKGQLGGMAKCLEDEEPRISDLAKLFFSELATKDNAIYNNLPDIISNLSTGKQGISEESFKVTMRFIFTFIDKEKQAEAIVEKLCQRYKLLTEARQWRDVAFCLSLLPYKSERSVRKLVECLPLYRDVLHEPEVFARFTEIAAKAKLNKAAKNESDLTEFEAALADANTRGQEDQAVVQKADKKRKAAPRRRRVVQATPPSSPD